MATNDALNNPLADATGTGKYVGDTDPVFSNNIDVAANIRHDGDTDNLIAFGADTQDYQTNGSSRLDISNSGVRLGGANSRVTTILDEDTMTSDSDTALATQQSIKAYVDSQSGGGGGGPKEITWLPGSFESNEPNPSSLEFLNGTPVRTMVRAFDDTTEEFVNGKFVVPGNIDTSGTVTIRTYSMAKTAAASKNVEYTFGYRALNDAEDFDGAYNTLVSGDLAVDSTQDNIQEDTWTETVANLGWAANDIVIFYLSRTAPSANNLSGDLFLFSLTIEIPRS